MRRSIYLYRTGRTAADKYEWEIDPFYKLYVFRKKCLICLRHETIRKTVFFKVGVA